MNVAGLDSPWRFVGTARILARGWPSIHTAVSPRPPRRCGDTGHADMADLMPDKHRKRPRDPNQLGKFNRNWRSKNVKYHLGAKELRTPQKNAPPWAGGATWRFEGPEGNTGVRALCPEAHSRSRSRRKIGRGSPRMDIPATRFHGSSMYSRNGEELATPAAGN